MAGFLGSGDLYFNRKVSGVDQGWILLGNATKFAIQEQSEIKERPSRMRATYGQVLDTVPIKQPAQISVTLDDINKDNLALAFMGIVSDYSQSSGSVTDESVTGKHDVYVDLANRNVSSVVLTDDPMSETYVEGTDYEVNTRLGMLKILSTGNIADGAALLVDYDYGAISGNQVQGGAEPLIRGAFRLDGRNFADDSLVIVDVWEGTLAPSSEFDFLSEDFAPIELGGSMTTPSGKSEPYIVQTDVVLS
ncbi:conserved hypothetical protein [Nitrosococcus halophilus Nc 4]|uniref:Uncharacterized protein n=1 Tax=Nitrosococcus halophilus (strain Nc4) TaxID=472759 RepID=D5BYW5_NITHN|nr:hypothetical protein [Nitrosococcus halophilus]ADE14178.1 conserved hypothetical protein [Nitrosococcus halophilus Nc 4]